MAARGRVSRRGPAAKGKKRGRPPLAPEEKARRKVQRDHDKMVREVFVKAGFRRRPELEGKDLRFADHLTTEFDLVFTHENQIVIVETTTSAPGRNLVEHLRKKKDAHAHILSHQTRALSVLCATSPDFADCVPRMAGHRSQINWTFVYAPRHDLDAVQQAMAPNTRLLGYRTLRYFKVVTDAVHSSARAELLAFLRIDFTRLARLGVVPAQGGGASIERVGRLLPEANSGFDTGYKVVSFYASAEDLLDRAFVLRRQGWRNGEGLFQRLVIPSKIASIRKHLKGGGGAFVNNIIVTLDEQTKILDESRNTVDPGDIERVNRRYPSIA